MMQVTEGRASQPIDADLGKLIWERLKSMAPDEEMKRTIHMASEKPMPAALQKALAVNLYGFAAGHVSVAKSEMHQFSCFRWSMQGTRSVGILSYKEARTFLGQGKTMSFQEMLSWGTSASLKEWRELLAACPAALFTGTVGPHDLSLCPAPPSSFTELSQTATLWGSVQDF